MGRNNSKREEAAFLQSTTQREESAFLQSSTKREEAAFLQSSTKREEAAFLQLSSQRKGSAFLQSSTKREESAFLQSSTQGEESAFLKSSTQREEAAFLHSSTKKGSSLSSMSPSSDIDVTLSRPMSPSVDLRKNRASLRLQVEITLEFIESYIKRRSPTPPALLIAMLERANILFVKADEVNAQLVDPENKIDFDVECMLQLNLFVMVETTKAKVDNYVHMHQERLRLQRLYEDQYQAEEDQHRARYRAEEAHYRAEAAQRAAEDAARAFREPQCASTPAQTTSHGARPVLHTLVESERSHAFRLTSHQPSRDRVEGQQCTQPIYQEGKQPFFSHRLAPAIYLSADPSPVSHEPAHILLASKGSQTSFIRPSFEDDYHHNCRSKVDGQHGLSDPPSVDSDRRHYDRDPQRPSPPRVDDSYLSRRAEGSSSYTPAFTSILHRSPDSSLSYGSAMDKHPYQLIHPDPVDSSLSTSKLYAHQTGEQSREFPVLISEREVEKEFQFQSTSRFKKAHHSSVSFPQPDDQCVPNDVMLHHRLLKKRKKEVSLLTSAYLRFHGPFRGEAVSADQGEFVAPARQLRLFKKRKKKESELSVLLHSASGEDVPAE